MIFRLHVLQKDTVFVDSFFCKIVDLGLAYISLRQKTFFNDDDILVVYCIGGGGGGGRKNVRSGDFD